MKNIFLQQTSISFQWAQMGDVVLNKPWMTSLYEAFDVLRINSLHFLSKASFFFLFS